ncbi:MAG: 23S rRNA (guanosine(2251)-2'-O)-methyltransferase RlmB [Lewinellaceae bacterium]|nr:23S rRNA (guanosine(2251)-2'-O)-methyltransferase RlmB [Saprospiraceae bacterium]MCB9338612.1 23S rRNA (guanosine(2251)-2'-O)-methyltransferase RlmB [Lewinellaceae bacterium]
MQPAKTTNFIYGRHPIFDAIESGAQLDKVFLQLGTRGDLEKEVRRLCGIHDIPLQYVPKERLHKMVGGNHQGLVAHISIIPYYRLEDVVPGIYEKGEIPILLLLDRVTDVRNFGAIARSAEVCGAHALVVPRTESALITADAIKTSAGALTRINVCREKSLVTAIEFLQNSGIQVFASDLKAEPYLFDLDLSVPVAMVVGAEDEGVHPSLLSRSDQRFRIPQQGGTDSLNVSVAAGIMLYEVLRQRH